MKKFIYIVALATSFHGLVHAQFLLDKGMDTIHMLRRDSVVALTFKLSGVKPRTNPKLTIKVNSGSAIEGKDFSLLDAYNNETRLIEITRVENKAGLFKMLVSGDIKTNETINLQIFINDEGKIIPDVSKIILVPIAQKMDDTEKKKADRAKKDSLEFRLYNDINIKVYKDDTTELKLSRAGFIKKQITKLINVFRVNITQRTPSTYRLEIISSENEIYYATIRVTNEYEFQTDDRLYLNGRPDEPFIHAKDIFILSELKATEKTKSDSENQTYHFSL